VQNGRGDKAQSICRDILNLAPGHAGALSLLGILAQAVNDHDGAARLFALAYRARPEDPGHAMNGALALMELGQEGAAVLVLEKAMERHPDHAGLYGLLGLAEAQRERWDAALAALGRAHRLDPDNLDHRYNLALTFDQSGDDGSAAEHYRAVLDRMPHHFDARNNLGLVLMRQGQIKEAGSCFQRAYRFGRHNGALINMGRMLDATGQIADAEQCLREATQADPGSSDALHYLGEFLSARRRHEEAAACFRRALIREGDTHIPRAGLLHSLRMQGAFIEADEMEAEVVAEALEDAAAGRRSALTPFMAMACTLTPEQEAAIARSHGRDLVRSVPSRQPMWRQSGRDTGGPKERLKIGYVSNDFRDQATAHLLVGLLEHHDRDRFEIACYSHSGAADDDYRHRIETAVDRFVDITDASHADAARRIVDDRIDIKGHTHGNRLAIFAHRPAPLQATYLGFPGTTGAPFMDILIADRTVVTDDLAGLYSEEVVFMDGCYQANDPRAPVAQEPAARAEVGLPDEAIVYACFNEPWKIGVRDFALWCRILNDVPGSLLWLRSNQAGTEANLRRSAQAHGIDPGRLRFAPFLPKDRHLARIRLADVFLDTLTVNAHTTASDALWAGLPLITVPGPRFASRVATSLLMAAGLDDLVCRDDEAYHRLAVTLGRDRQAMRRLRERCAGPARTPLFDAAGRAQQFEAVLEQSWQERQPRS